MKYLCLVYLEPDKLHAVPDSECAMSGQRLRERGVLVAAEALQPIDTATTVRVRAGKVLVTDGPFAETKELIAGFWLWECNSLQEAIEWAKRCPNPMLEECEIEIRPLFEAADFGEAFESICVQLR